MSAITCVNSNTSNSSSNNVASGPSCGGGGSSSSVEQYGNLQFSGHSQSHAIVYVVVILVLYFSILLVLICRYMRKERNQFRLPAYISSGILKKERYSRCARDLETSHLSTVSTQMMMDKEQQPTSALLPASGAMAHMDTAV